MDGSRSSAATTNHDVNRCGQEWSNDGAESMRVCERAREREIERGGRWGRGGLQFSGHCPELDNPGKKGGKVSPFVANQSMPAVAIQATRCRILGRARSFKPKPAAPPPLRARLTPCMPSSNSRAAAGIAPGRRGPGRDGVRWKDMAMPKSERNCTWKNNERARARAQKARGGDSVESGNKERERERVLCALWD